MNGITFNLYNGDCRDEIALKVFKIYSDNFGKKFRVPETVLINRINTKKCSLILMYLNNTLIGFSMIILLRHLKSIFIDYIAIDTKYHGKGYGKLLFNHIYDSYVLNSSYINNIVLECDDKLVNMYIKWGCTRVPIQYNTYLGNHFNLMVKTNITNKMSFYYKLYNTLIAINQSYFLEKFYINFFLKYMETKIINLLHILVDSLLRDIYGNSRIYYNFPDGFNYPLCSY